MKVYNQGMTEGLSFEEQSEDREKLEEQLTVAVEACRLFDSPLDEDQNRLVEAVLPHASEVFGIVLDASQNTWEFLAGEAERLRIKLGGYDLERDLLVADGDALDQADGT